MNIHFFSFQRSSKVYVVVTYVSIKVSEALGEGGQFPFKEAQKHEKTD